jgi:hypothetical protein
MGSWSNSSTIMDECWMIKYGWNILYIHHMHGWKFQCMGNKQTQTCDMVIFILDKHYSLFIIYDVQI